MESSDATHIHFPSPNDENGMMPIFDKDFLRNLKDIPKEFYWPSEEIVESSKEELRVPVIDLGVLKTGDEAAIAKAAELVRNACIKHGFFQVTNHGVDPNLINAAYQEMDTIFNLPMTKKLIAKKKPGTQEGYAGAHGDRYSSKLPWKETLTWIYDYNKESKSQVVDFFDAFFGGELHRTGLVYQKYCDAVKEFSPLVLELLAISLGVDRLQYVKFYEDGMQLMRCNSYPACVFSDHTLGTGPHNDPTGVTFLHQDQVGGLEVFVDNKWLALHSRPDAFIINIGDCFMALTNGIYKSCLHRVLANKERERKSLACFMNSRVDKAVRPPEALISPQEPRKYPDFTWAEFRDFTQEHHRADPETLDAFVSWIRSSNPPPE
ncbi:hypothetical protein RIF29_42480 [Crotalaria pallida]|uniref:Fe2OG dioxygenase domain-containing protein n=1 Tax=Crotalaria pallida TaxID=3830 RepID=A0AAN9E703_CROPI